MMIEKTLRSFLDQTIDENSYEIVVCDNNSTDDTKLVLDQLIEEFPKGIRCFIEKRQGVHTQEIQQLKNLLVKYCILQMTI
jgi:glycosyltransferase involved in cell wall biosynthesis